MDIFQIVNMYNPIWSEKETIVISIVLLLGFFCMVFLYWKGLIRLRQGIAGMLLLIYLLTVFGSTGNILVMEGDFKSNWKDECIIAGRAFYRKYSEYDFTIPGGNFVSNYMESESALVERSGVWYNSFDRH